MTPDEAHAFVHGFAADTKAELDRAEIEAIRRCYETLLTDVLDGAVGIHELTDHQILKDIHGEALGGIWSWAGQYRVRDLSIGVDPSQVTNEVGILISLLIDANRASWFPPHELALRAHHQITRIHPFVDVNGRISRLYADVLLACLTPDDPLVIDWEPADQNKSAYINALRHADQAAGDVSELKYLLPTKQVL